MRELQVGDRLGDRIEVTSGLKPGERVAITDVETLNGGELVTVTKYRRLAMLSEFCVRRPVSATMLVMSWWCSASSRSVSSASICSQGRSRHRHRRR